MTKQYSAVFTAAASPQRKIKPMKREKYNFYNRMRCSYRKSIQAIRNNLIYINVTVFIIL